MNQEIKEQLSAAGMNVEGALERLMNNEMLLERLLIKFKADTNFAGLEKALGENKYEEAFHFAHTLKGVAGNLGMEKLMDADSLVVERLRRQDYEGMEADMAALQEAYTQIMEILQKIG
ncbi:MAG: Hpt domain-containing protein [Lachnospiraceae bacterium]|nr:Hpt domain-containing protein [Lachnospiraceae bacterium]